MQNSSENRIIGFWYKDFSIAQAGEIYFTKDNQENPVLLGSGKQYSQIDQSIGLTGSVSLKRQVEQVYKTTYKFCVCADSFANTKIKLYRRSYNQDLLLRESLIITPEYYTKDNSIPTNIIYEKGISLDVVNFDFAEYVVILEKPNASQLLNFSAWLELSAS